MGKQGAVKGREAGDEKRWGTGWCWRLGSYKQLTPGQLNKCRP